MKRSRSIRLVLLGSVGLIGLAGCDQSDPLSKSDFFTDQAECAKVKDADSCRQALADARAKHIQTAPAFTSREECEAQFGAENCMETKEQPGQAQSSSSHTSSSSSTTYRSSGGSWFMPIMMGYMMGRGAGAPSGQPVYRNTTNTAFSGGKPVGRFDDRLSPPPRPAGSVAGVPTARGGSAAPTTSRGGFGSTSSSSSHSSGSSSS